MRIWYQNPLLEREGRCQPEVPYRAMRYEAKWQASKDLNPLLHLVFSPDAVLPVGVCLN